MLKRLLQLGLVVLMGCVMVVGSSREAKAAGESVTVSGVVLSKCGAQGIPFSGTTTGAGRLDVSVDGVVKYTTPVQGTAVLWVTPFIQTPTSQHTVLAALYSTPGEGESQLLASDSKVFTVAACQQVSGGGGGDEKDCCPGKDPEEPAVAPKGKVLGASTDGGGNDCSKLVCLKGEVYNLSEDQIEVKYAKADGTIVYRNFHMIATTEMRDHIRIGSQVQIYFEAGTNVALIVKDLSPDGMENLWGAVNETPIYD